MKPNNGAWVTYQTDLAPYTPLAVHPDEIEALRFAVEYEGQAKTKFVEWGVDLNHAINRDYTAEPEYDPEPEAFPMPAAGLPIPYMPADPGRDAAEQQQAQRAAAAPRLNGDDAENASYVDKITLPENHGMV